MENVIDLPLTEEKHEEKRNNFADAVVQFTEWFGAPDEKGEYQVVWFVGRPGEKEEHDILLKIEQVPSSDDEILVSLNDPVIEGMNFDFATDADADNILMFIGYCAVHGLKWVGVP
jgi:hypothetical protein